MVVSDERGFRDDIEVYSEVEFLAFEQERIGKIELGDVVVVDFAAFFAVNAKLFLEFEDFLII